MKTETTYNNPGSPFHGFPVISTYTDRQAVEDGVLVDTSGFGPRTKEGKPVNRVTIALFHTFTRKLLGGAMTDITHLKIAIEYVIAHGERDGDWYTGEAVANDEVQRIWIIPNEVDGYTAMFPEDY